MAVALVVFVGVHFYRRYGPANDLLLVPANGVHTYEVDERTQDVHTKEDGSDRDSGLPAPHEEHVETKGRGGVENGDSHAPEVDHMEAPDNSHSNVNNPPPGDLSDTVVPPLQRTHNERQGEVVAMFKHAWMGYTKYAWGQDELHPISKSGGGSFHMGLTIIDSLDTMWLMGLIGEFRKAREWVAHHLDFAAVHNKVSVFETNIRVLGGLLAAFHLSNDRIFLQKAVSIIYSRAESM